MTELGIELLAILEGAVVCVVRASLTAGDDGNDSFACKALPEAFGFIFLLGEDLKKDEIDCFSEARFVNPVALRNMEVITQ